MYTRKYKEPTRYFLTQEEIIAYMNWYNDPEGTHCIFHKIDAKGNKVEIRLPAIQFTIPQLAFKSAK